MTDHLVLGTAQLGLAYGINNVLGKPSQDAVDDIIRAAWVSGIKDFDTAQGYGDSEQVLGDALMRLGLSERVDVMTKLDPKLDINDLSNVTASVDRSLMDLNISCIDGLMLHDENLLSRWHDGLGAALRGLVNDGRVKRLGVSVYAPSKAMEALNNPDIDFVQCPSNILDRRFEAVGVFALAKRLNKRVYVRSIFLQGLLLMEIEKIPVRIPMAREIVTKLEQYANESGLSRKALCLAYVQWKWPEAYIIFGAESKHQVMENVALWQQAPSNINIFHRIEAEFAFLKEDLLNVALWPK